jgi:hypothetical protein
MDYSTMAGHRVSVTSPITVGWLSDAIERAQALYLPRSEDERQAQQMIKDALAAGDLDALIAAMDYAAQEHLSTSQWRRWWSPLRAQLLNGELL